MKNNYYNTDDIDLFPRILSGPTEIEKIVAE